MIRHVVFFKFKPGIAEVERTAALEELRSLPARINVIREFEVKEDVLRSPRSWDAVLIATYDHLQSLEEYAKHEAHVGVARRLQQLCDSIGSVDYEI